jgi:hypothetical protein
MVGGPPWRDRGQIFGSGPVAWFPPVESADALRGGAETDFG